MWSSEVPFRHGGAAQPRRLTSSGAGAQVGEIAGRQNRSPREELVRGALIGLQPREKAFHDVLASFLVTPKFPASIPHDPNANSFGRIRIGVAQVAENCVKLAAKATGTRALIRVPSALCSACCTLPSSCSRATKSPRS